MHARYYPVVIAILIALFAPSIGLRAQSRRGPQFQFPLHGSRWVLLGTSIIIRPGAPVGRAVGDAILDVRGSASGAHAGTLAVAEDGRTLIFRPATRFAPGESVTVSVGGRLRDALGEAIAPWSFTFGTSLTAEPLNVRPSEMDELRPRAAAPNAAAVPAGAAPLAMPSSDDAAPDDFPRVTVTASNDPSAGLFYLSNIAFDLTLDNTPYLMMLDNAGVPVFSRKVDGQGLDFKRQGVGAITYGDRAAARFYALDGDYDVADSFACDGGYEVDIHDLEILPNGHFVIIGLDPQLVDMSAIVPGGRPDARVIGIVIQELDAARNLVFQWRSFDHFEITDAAHEDLTAEVIDYVHPNSLQIDTDGAILMSSRHLDEVTKIDRTTGEIIWRLGGRRNQFTFIGDTIGFCYQHAARRIANGHITLFDNGNFHAPPFSRGVEYAVDEAAKTATLVWQYRHTPDIFGFAMGNMQRLADGNSLISWGATNTALTEVRPDGTTALELRLPRGIFSYRAFKFPGAGSSTVSLVSPADGAPGIMGAPALCWNPAPGAVGYVVQMAADPSFSAPLVDATLPAGTTRRVVDAALNASYYWRVRPVFASGDGDWSKVWRFHTGLTAVVAVVPGDGEGKQPLAPLFGWKRVGGAETYHVQIARDSLFAAIAIDDSLARPFGNLGLLDTLATYYWRVRWENDSLAGLWSATRSFTVAGPPEAAGLVAPPDNASDLPTAVTLRWNPVLDASHYRVQLSTAPDFSTLILHDSNFIMRRRRVEGLDTNTVYYWRVRPTAIGIDGPWSQPRSFRTGGYPEALPAPAPLVSPPDRARLVEDTTTFIWERSTPYVSDYRFMLSTDSAFATLAIDSLTADTALALAGRAFADSVYWWRVSAINALGEGPASPARAFTVGGRAGAETGGRGREEVWLRSERSGADVLLRYSVASAGAAHLAVVDERGAVAAVLIDGRVERGEGAVRFETRGLPSGRYFCRLTAGGMMAVEKIIVER